MYEDKSKDSQYFHFTLRGSTINEKFYPFKMHSGCTGPRNPAIIRKPVAKLSKYPIFQHILMIQIQFKSHYGKENTVNCPPRVN